MASTWFGMERRLRFTMLRLFLFASCVGVALGGEWSCTSANPETTGTYNCTSDCTMTSAGVQLSGDLSITGQPELTTITAKTSGTRRHFHVASGDSHTLTLKWLKLTGGSQSDGGSIYLLGSGTLHTTSCVFFVNHAPDGGAVYGRTGSSIQLYHTNITNNTAGFGGGLYSKQGSILLEDSIIAMNTATHYGGGIFQQEGTLDIYRSEVRENNQITDMPDRAIFYRVQPEQLHELDRMQRNHRSGKQCWFCHRG
eukprot:g1819.t1